MDGSRSTGQPDRSSSGGPVARMTGAEESLRLTTPGEAAAVASCWSYSGTSGRAG